MCAKRISRNQPCPCGSGKKFKHCCYNKSFTYEEDGEGNAVRSVPIDDQLAEMLDNHLKSLGPSDPEDRLFRNLNLEGAEFEMSRAMELANVDPAIIYAFQETGFLLSEENMDRFPQKDIDLWQSKIEEYYRTQTGDSSGEFPLGTIALYGPDDKHTTKIVAGVFLHSSADPILERFVGSNILRDSKVRAAIKAIFTKYKVKKVVHSGGNIGCPHEEGEDFPTGEDCPFCPYWRGKQGSGAL